MMSERSLLLYHTEKNTKILKNNKIIKIKIKTITINKLKNPLIQTQKRDDFYFPDMHLLVLTCMYFIKG